MEAAGIDARAADRRFGCRDAPHFQPRVRGGWNTAKVWTLLCGRRFLDTEESPLRFNHPIDGVLRSTMYAARSRLWLTFQSTSLERVFFTGDFYQSMARITWPASLEKPTFGLYPTIWSSLCRGGVVSILAAAITGRRVRSAH